MTGLARDLDQYLIDYNYDRATPGASPKDASRRHRLRSAQNQPGTMTTCRTNPGLGRAPPSHLVGLIRPAEMAASVDGEGERNEGGVPTT